MWWRALLVLMLIATAIASPDAWTALSDAEWWRQQLARCEYWRATHPVLFTLGFGLVFALLSALTLPGCSVLALVAGPLFGPIAGTLLLGAASTAGAVLPFLGARHLARDAAQARHGHRLQSLEALLVRGGPWSLLALRVVPLVPFPVLNPLLGLTRMSLRSFVLPSFAGLTLASVPWVWLGQSAHRATLPDAGHALMHAAAAVLMLLGLVALRLRLARKDVR